MPLFKSFLAKLIAVLVCLGLLFGVFVYGMSQPASAVPGEPVSIVIKPGMSAAEIGTLLHDNGLIKNITVFRLIVHAQRLESSLQAGEYAFTRNMKIPAIIAMIAKGEIAYQQFTVPEGLTVNEVARLLAEKKVADADKFSKAAAEFPLPDYVVFSDQASFKLEGYLFPDTYRVPRGATEETIVRTMVGQFNKQLTPELRAKAKEQGLSIRDTIILASLVEKEARFADERPIIAGVFLKRLKEEMPLQSCATIQFILGYPKPELTVKDTEIVSPYNTYLNAGLPPGPIASPGLSSIKAVLSPAMTEYLYFVADKNGKHHFSRTYSEHLAAIDRIGS
mgnify:CR=1 FL=1